MASNYTLNGTPDTSQVAEDEGNAELLYQLPSPEPGCDIVVDIPPPGNGNALQLHVPYSPNSNGSKSPTVPNRSEDILEAIMPLDVPNPSVSNPRPFRVRFRSRVRIGSGFRHKRSASQPKPIGGEQTGSPDSDTSPSSSISAPLRCTPDEHEPDGQLVGNRRNPYGSFALGPKRTRRASAGMYTHPSMGSRRSRPIWLNDEDEGEGERAGERTRLLRAPGSNLGARTRRLYGLTDEDDEDEDESRARERKRRAREMKEMHKVVFGEWPWRLFNGYVRPFICVSSLSPLLPPLHVC